MSHVFNIEDCLLVCLYPPNPYSCLKITVRCFLHLKVDTQVQSGSLQKREQFLTKAVTAYFYQLFCLYVLNPLKLTVELCPLSYNVIGFATLLCFLILQQLNVFQKILKNLLCISFLSIIFSDCTRTMYFTMAFKRRNGSNIIIIFNM